MRPSVLCACTGGAIAAVTTVVCGQPSFTPLGIPQGAVRSVATAMSVDGSVVAGYSQDGASNSRAWRWTAAGGQTLMPFLTGDTGCIAYAISGDGARIVGASINQQLDGSQACLWTSAGTVVSGLGDLAGGDFHSVAYGITTNGATVVGVGDSTLTEAFRRQSSPVGLGFLPGGSWSEAYGVDGNGVAVGFSENEDFAFEAVRWTFSGIVGLGFPPFCFQSIAWAVTPGGQVIVGEALDFDVNTHAFRWTQATGMVLLGTIPGYLGESAYATNSAGTVIVGVAFDGQNHPQAMIWDGVHGVRLLQGVLTSLGLGPSLSGWTLTKVNALSADGTWIAGTGIDPTGKEQAWVARLGYLCYPNCDESTVAPILNVADFTCFLTRFAGGLTYANCDASTSPPTLNIADFTCFLQKFAAGCS